MARFGTKNPSEIKTGIDQRTISQPSSLVGPDPIEKLAEQQPRTPSVVGQFELDTLLLGKLVDDDEDGFAFREIVDLKNKYGVFTLGQSVSQPCMSLIVTAIDGTEVFEKLGTRGMQGEEWVYLKLSVPERDSIELLFYVTAITPVSTIADSKGHTFNLICHTKELIVNNITTINQSFPSFTTSEVAQYVYERYLLRNKKFRALKTASFGSQKIWKERPYIIHDSVDADTFIVPGLQPFNAMNWLATKSYGGPNYPGSKYSFFETNKGFYFANIERLIEENKGKGRTFRFQPLQSQDPKGAITYFSSIKNMGDMSIMSSSQRLNNGTYSHSVRTINIVKKNHTDRKFSMDRSFDLFKGTGNLFNNTQAYFDTFGKVEPFEYTTIKDHTQPETHSEEIIGKRFAFDDLVSTYRLTISVYGDTSINAGDVITIERDSPTTAFESDRSMYGGYWFVIGVGHVCDHGQMGTNLELVKSGLELIHNKEGDRG